MNSILDTPRIIALTTINATLQPAPEIVGGVARRYRLFGECLRRLSTHELAQADQAGRPVADGLGMESVISTIAPLFAQERSLIKWVALRGALTALHVHTINDDSLVAAFSPTVEFAMGVGHTGDVAAGETTVGVGAGWADRVDEQQAANAIGLFRALAVRLFNYEQYATLSVEQVNDHPLLQFSDPVGLEFIGWSAIALLRLGIGSDLASSIPQPDELTEPGWYTEPLLAQAERFWDGRDWTAQCRVSVDGHYQAAEMPLVSPVSG